jgi:transposase-like protein
MLVLIRATPESKKELVGFQVGARESAQSWRELLVEVKRRGLKSAPEIAVGDGALGFWKALDEIFPGAKHQRCWVRKTANVLNKVAVFVQPSMKRDLREVWLSPNRAAAETAIDVFAEKCGAKYPKAVECLTKDRQTLLAFYDFPAEHWDHLRTSNPIASLFSTVRHRAVRTKGSLSSATAKLMAFKLIMAASNPSASSGLAPIERRKAIAESHRRRQFPRWNRAYQNAVTERRLIRSSPKFEHSSGHSAPLSPR